jgi:hypothetical protein
MIEIPSGFGWTMQKFPPSRSQTSAKSLRRRELLRATAAGFILVGIFAVALDLGAHWQMPSLGKIVHANAARPQAEDDLTTGSIVYVPDFGDKCRQSEIDNATWQVRQIGTVSCHEALAGRPPSHSETRPRTRIDIIRESFRRSAD